MATSTVAPPNTTADIYRNGHSPSSPPDVSGVPVLLLAVYGDARLHVSVFKYDANSNPPLSEFFSDRWTHLMYCGKEVDVRDGYATGLLTPTEDIVYIPDQYGTPFAVRFVERINRGLASDHLRVYLDRGTPRWPTNQL